MDDSMRPDRRRHPSAGPRRLPVGAHTPPTGRHSTVISCDDCAMQCTAACDDCVVTFLLRADTESEPLVLDAAEERAVRLLARAGLVPALQYQVAV